MTNKIPRRSPEQRTADRLARIENVARKREPIAKPLRSWGDKSAAEILRDVQSYRDLFTQQGRGMGRREPEEMTTRETLELIRGYRQAELPGWSTLTGEHSHHRTS